MLTVNQLFERKGRDVWSVTPGTSVFDALQLMNTKNVGALLVLDNERIAGIFSERDYARKVVLVNRSSKDTPVRDIMTADVLTIRPDQTVAECMTLMSDHRIRHLPVVEGDTVVGVVSIGDIVKAVISEQEFMIGQLQQYIVGG